MHWKDATPTAAFHPFPAIYWLKWERPAHGAIQKPWGSLSAGVNPVANMDGAFIPGKQILTPCIIADEAFSNRVQAMKFFPVVLAMIPLCAVIGACVAVP